MRSRRVTLNGFEQGYREGWMSVAGTAPLPENPTQPQPGERRDFNNGFFYGRGDALERFAPGVEAKPLSYDHPPPKRGPSHHSE